MTGANQHMTNSTKDMIDLVDVSNLKLIVGHPNGTVAKITYVGNLKLNNDVIMFNVLVMPEYIVSLLSDWGIPLYFLSECILAATYLINMLPSSVLNGKSSFSLVYGREPNIYHLRSFGCLCYDALVKGPNDDEKGPSGRDGSVHQPDFDSYNQAGYDEQHTATPIGCKSWSEKVYAKSYCFVSNLNKSSKPFSFEEASKDVNWISATNDEMHVLYENDTWYMTDLPNGRKPIGSIDYEETFSTEQAPRQWNLKLSEALREAGFEQSKNDQSFFRNKFKIKDLREFLGIEVSKTSNGLCLSQRKYFLELLHEFGLLAYRPVLTSLVGTLIYLTLTIPDISYDVRCLSQHMHSPLKSHFDISLRLLKYLKLAPGNGIQFLKRQNDFNIIAFSDFNWARCPITRRSVSGYCVFVYGCLVSWKSKKHATLSKSLAEAEYRSMVAATCEVMWIVKIMRDLNVNNLIPADLY
ncbi:ribonuclease H-like domain-containing protein [Tanacetum coccineum]